MPAHYPQRRLLACTPCRCVACLHPMAGAPLLPPAPRSSSLPSPASANRRPRSHGVQKPEGICGVYVTSRKNDKRTEHKAFYNHCEVALGEGRRRGWGGGVQSGVCCCCGCRPGRLPAAFKRYLTLPSLVACYSAAGGRPCTSSRSPTTSRAIGRHSLPVSRSSCTVRLLQPGHEPQPGGVAHRLRVPRELRHAARAAPALPAGQLTTPGAPFTAGPSPPPPLFAPRRAAVRGLPQGMGRAGRLWCAVREAVLLNCAWPQPNDD